MEDCTVVMLVAQALPVLPRYLGKLRLASSWHSEVLQGQFIAALCARVRHRHGPTAMRALAALGTLAERSAAALGQAAAASLKAIIADRKYMLTAVQQDVRLVRHLPADRELVLAALRKSAGALRHAAPELKADREVVLAAVRKDGDALKHAAPVLLADRDIVLEALRKDAGALKHAAPELRDDPKLLHEAFQWQQQHQLPYLRHWGPGGPGGT
eukprot:CAMPEP_0204578690 /NCGR_PEP_ID=MMETSP0661-20131031/43072_1 /ASSEMBLY_ACC=CAM_ASM_000606 /TAXON_ID=109239 /ORGANISM="Alexandrium margalefi, Strain AMGDE01CS-322" /LENGTH=213 /DNA_ID=CAMNT_0051587643 /DNA_START=103 /DNA_END=744 /DNA_ORIENTATION=+